MVHLGSLLGLRARSEDRAPRSRLARTLVASASACVVLGWVWPNAGASMFVGADGGRTGSLSDSTVAASPVVNLSQSESRSSHPAVSRTGSTWLVVWEEGGSLEFAARTNGAWRSPSAVPSAMVGDPAVAAGDSGRFDLVWSEFSEIDGNFEILLSYYAEREWSLPEVVSNTPGESLSPDISVDRAGNPVIVWSEVDATGPQLYLATGGPGGSWALGPIPGAEGENPALVVTDEGITHIAWRDDADGDGAADALYVRRDSGGWGLVELVSAVGGPAVGPPALAVDDMGAAALAWHDAGGVVWFAERSEGEWTAPIELEDAEGATGAPSLAIADGTTGVAWPIGSEVRMVRRLAGVWSQPEVALAFGVSAHTPRIAASTTGFGIVAEGRAAGAAGDIYFSELPLTPEATASPTSTEPLTTSTAGTPTTRTPTAVGHTPTATPPPTVGSGTLPPGAPSLYVPWAGKG